MDASDADTSVQTASADQQASQPQRSRATVVCGECKRLKLKCDRKQPCGSCLKRDSVQKCLYSAAAIERLDIHSLNNRLTHVETFTMTYTNGRFQPAYSSANHPSSQTFNQSTQPNPVGYQHQHQHHLNQDIVVETFSDPFQNIISTCLRDLGFAQNSASTHGDIKLEPSASDNIAFYGRLSNSRRMSKSQLRQASLDHRSHARTNLPPITVYVPATPSDPRSHVPQNSAPQVTPELLSFLPPLATCQRLLQRAGDIFRVRPLPFDPSYGSGHEWNGLERKFLQFLTNAGKNNEVKRPRAVPKRAKDIYFAGPSQPRLNESSLLDAGDGVGYMVNSLNAGDGGHSSLTFFAMTCAALAIGAVSSPIEDDCALVPSSATFFYALSQQALGIWDTHVSSSASKHFTSNGDAEQFEYLFACLLGVVYLLQSGTIAAASMYKVDDDVQDEDMETGERQNDDSQIVSSLVGKMVTVARNMHLNKEANWAKRKKRKSSDRDRSRDEWKRMVWWEIVFYDLFIADALCQQPHISPSPDGTNIPSCAIYPPTTEGEKPVSNDALHGTDQERGVQNADLHPDQLTTETLVTEAYFGARYRLARVAQAIKGRNSLAGCCYTLDQAVALENQVREWQDMLPDFLKISGDDERQSMTASLDASHVEGTLRRLQAYELAIISNVLVINVYMPFLGMHGDDRIKSRFMNLPAASACIHAAQAIVHLADGLQSLLASPSIPPSFPSKVMPLMFQFIPLEKLVFDAVVVCAHAVFAGKSPSMAFSTGMMAEDASLGLEILRKLGPPLLSSVIERDGDDEFQHRVVNTLHARLVQRSTRLKRKLDEEITCGDHGDLGALHPQIYQVSEDDPPTQHHTFVMDSLSPSSTIESDYSSSQSPSSTRQPSRPNREPKGLNKEKGKRTKGTKKHPAVGLRIREANSIHPVPPSHPRQLAQVEDVWKLEQQIRMGSTLANSSPSTDAQTMPAVSPLAASGGSFTGTGRSRSPSASGVHPQPVDSSQRFRTPLAHTPDEMGMPPRKRLLLQDIREQQLQPHPRPFVPHFFDPGHHQTQQDIDYNQLTPPTTFDGSCPTGTMDSAAYRVASSTQNSYMSVSEHPTPTYDRLPLSSIAHSSYFPSPTSYLPAYSEQLPSSNVVGLRHPPAPANSAATVVDSQPPIMTVSSPPVYERPHQPPVENYSHMQDHPYLVSGEPQHSVNIYDLGDSTVTGLGW